MAKDDNLADEQAPTRIARGQPERSKYLGEILAIFSGMDQS